MQIAVLIYKLTENLLMIFAPAFLKALPLIREYS